MSQRSENLEQFAIDVILGRRQGARATAPARILYFMSFGYERAVLLRLFLYRHRIFRERTLGCLVVSIGNLTVGGTGKTPVVEKFARALRDGGRQVAILSRGYKSVPQPTNETDGSPAFEKSSSRRRGLSRMANHSCSIPAPPATSPTCWRII